MNNGIHLLLLCGGLLAFTPLNAETEKTALFFPAGETADAPFGFRDMCARDHALCLMGDSPRPEEPAFQTGPAHMIPASLEIGDLSGTGATPSPSLAMMIKIVNADVNRAVVQVSDMDSIGVPERWNRLSNDAHPVGDCEDIAIEKRARLEKAGFPPQRLFYVVAFVPRYGLHTVLIARLDDGDYVLDNLSPHILRWDRVHYQWLRQQMPGNPLQWSRIETGSGHGDYADNRNPRSGKRNS